MVDKSLVISALSQKGKPSLQQVLEQPNVKRAMVNPQIEATHDVPYGAGSSVIGVLTHVDRRIPVFDPKILGSNNQPLNLHHALNVHEQVERQAMEMGLPYHEAHKDYATPTEKSFVEGQGANWKTYSEAMDGYLKETEHEHPENPPPTLYLKPYPHKEEEFMKRKDRKEFQGNPVMANALMSGQAGGNGRE